MKFQVLFISILAGGVCAVPAADWPNWRGPNHNGVSEENGWLAQWPVDGPRQLWKKSLGTGFSTISVAQGRAYTVGNQGDKDTVFCFDAETGQPLWHYTYPSPLDPNIFEGGPTATPTVSGQSVYSVGRQGEVFCFNATNGAVLWSSNVAKEVGAAKPTWGFSSSVLLEQSTLYVNIGSRGAALEADSGKVIWKSDAEPCGYATPVATTISGKPLLLMMEPKQLVAVDKSDGKEIWSFLFATEYDLNVADPVVVGDRVLVSAGYDHGCALLQIKDGRAEAVYENHELRSHFGTPVLYGGAIFGIDGNATDAPPAPLKCLDAATGAVRWSKPGFGTGGFLIADGKLIVLTAQGELVIAEASPAGYKELSRAQVLGGKCWTMPVLANGRIYCRNAKGDLVCLDVKGS